MSTFRRSIQIVLCTAALAVSFVASAAQSATRERARIGDVARSANTQRTAIRQDGHYHASRVMTLPNGKQIARVTDANVDRAAGTWDRVTTVTGPNGAQRSVAVDGQRTDSGYTREVVRTGPNGGATTRDVTANYDPATRTWTRESQTTGAQGRTRSSSRTVTRAP